MTFTGVGTSASVVSHLEIVIPIISDLLMSLIVLYHILLWFLSKNSL